MDTSNLCEHVQRHGHVSSFPPFELGDSLTKNIPGCWSYGGHNQIMQRIRPFRKCHVQRGLSPSFPSNEKSGKVSPVVQWTVKSSSIILNVGKYDLNIPMFHLIPVLKLLWRMFPSSSERSCGANFAKARNDQFSTSEIMETQIQTSLCFFTTFFDPQTL